MELLRAVFGSMSIFLTQLLLAVAFAGVGLALRRSFGLRRVGLDDCFLAFWVGLAAVTLFLLLWNFLLPVRGAALPLVLAAGALGIAAARRELAQLFEHDTWRPSLRFLVILLLLGLWLGNLGLAAPDNYDDGLYHIQAIHWAEQYPAIPGLANLDGPLAFNNANLLYDALLSAGPWKGRENHLANGLLILVFLCQSGVAGARLLAGELKPRRLFEFLLFAPAAAMALHGGASTFVTDPAPVLAVMVAVIQLYALFAETAAAPEEDSYRFVAVAALLALAVTFKSNMGFFAAACFPLTLLFWLRRRRPGTVLLRRTLGWAMAAILALAAAWMGRGAVLSGYPLFPITVAGLPVEWRAPAEHAKAELAFIRHSGRGSTRNHPVVAGEAGFRTWFPRWLPQFSETPYEIAIPSGLAVLGGLALLVLRRRVTPQVRSQLSSGAWILLPLVVAIVAWFLAAPEPRYARAFFWCLAALLWCQAFRVRLAASAPGRAGPVFLPAGLLAVSPIFISPWISAESPYHGSNPISAILKSNVNRPGTDLWFQTLEDKPLLSRYRTRSGLELNIVKNQCWDAPLPCTKTPAPNLRLRRPPDLSKGFVVDGPWQMENWPTGRQPTFLEDWRQSPTGRAAHQASLHTSRP